MSTVFRSGRPPKDKPNKITLTMDDMSFSEDRLVSWLRSNVQSPVQYDFVVFMGAKPWLHKTIQITLWFSSRRDAQQFSEEFTA